MAPKKRRRLPRVLLIVCEGKTEKAYFDILSDIFRSPRFVKVVVYGQQGQHLALIDNAVTKRGELCKELERPEEEVECWAVCDEDQMPCSYSKLEHYAESLEVRLAFSAPQFEMYLLQHFVQSGSVDRADVFRQLTHYRNQYGGEGDYCDETKSDLTWMAKAIDDTPKIVKTAITNSDIRSRSTKRPFFTVQELSKRILELSNW